MVLHLPELHRHAPQVVVQLHRKDGRRSALILRTLSACRKRDPGLQTLAAPLQTASLPHRSVRNIFHQSDSPVLTGPLSHSAFRPGKDVNHSLHIKTSQADENVHRHTRGGVPGCAAAVSGIGGAALGRAACLLLPQAAAGL